MKFSLLIASVAAVKITTEATAERCVSEKQSDEVFDKVDTNHNGQISEKELRRAIVWSLKHVQAKDLPTKEEAAQFKNVVAENAGADHQLNKAEFNALANDIASMVFPKKCHA